MLGDNYKLGECRFGEQHSGCRELTWLGRISALGMYNSNVMQQHFTLSLLLSGIVQGLLHQRLERAQGIRGLFPKDSSSIDNLIQLVDTLKSIPSVQLLNLFNELVNMF